MARKRNHKWRSTWIAALLLCVASLSPLGAPVDTFEPRVYGIPYTFWMGFLITVALVVLTYVATRVYAPDEASLDAGDTGPRGPSEASG